MRKIHALSLPLYDKKQWDRSIENENKTSHSGNLSLFLK